MPPQETPHFSNIPKKKESLESLWHLLKILMSNLDFNEVVNKVVNSILSELGYLNLGYRIVVLSLVDEKIGGLRRIALSQTEEARRAKSVSTIPFEKIVIPLTATSNYGVRVLKEGKPLVTTHWPDLLTPPLTPDAALTNQWAAGIKTSMVYPVYAREKPIGSLIFSMVKDYSEVTEEEKDLLGGFADLVGLAVQNSMLYSSLHKTTKELQDANKKLEELDMLKDDFVSIASHELRTPMTAIRSYAWMALNRPDVTLTERMKKYLSRVLSSTERLINLVNDMLNISRIESGRIDITPEVFDLKLLVEEVFSEVEPKAREKNLNLQIFSDNIPKVFADQDKVHQILLNLIGNALKFTPENGAITVSFFSDGKVVETSVKDNGVGISAEDLQNLFKKFGRLDSSYVAAATSGGTGLGLYITKSLIELMKGKIWVNSEGPGKGSVFTFSLPAATPQVLAQPHVYSFKAQGEAKQLEPANL